MMKYECYAKTLGGGCMKLASARLELGDQHQLTSKEPSIVIGTMVDSKTRTCLTVGRT